MLEISTDRADLAWTLAGLARRNRRRRLGVARYWRDNSRTYCTIYGPTRDGGFRQLTYSPEGQPFLLTHEDPEVFTVTTRAEAAARMFAIDSPPPAE
jgi:hypothetical protein